MTADLARLAGFSGFSEIGEILVVVSGSMQKHPIVYI